MGFRINSFSDLALIALTPGLGGGRLFGVGKF